MLGLGTEIARSTDQEGSVSVASPPPAPTYFLGSAYWTALVQQEISVITTLPATDYDYVINGNVTAFGAKIGSSLMISWDYFSVGGPPSVDIRAYDAITGLYSTIVTVQMDQNIPSGTGLFNFCAGTTLMGRFTDGSGGYYDSIVEEFSAQCPT